MRNTLTASILATVLFSLAHAVEIKSDGSRQFVGSDLTGKFELFVEQGSCPQSILHKEFGGLSRGAYQVLHSKILQDDEQCTGDGSLVVLSKKAIDEAGPEATEILKSGNFKEIIDALEKQSTDFLVGYEFEKRSCGKSSISAGSKFIFVEDSKQIKIPGLIELFPGTKYMIVYDNKSPTPCTYSAQSSGHETGAAAPSPKPINAKPAPQGSSPSGNGSSGGSGSSSSSDGSSGSSSSGATGSGTDSSSRGTGGTGSTSGTGASGDASATSEAATADSDTASGTTTGEETEEGLLGVPGVSDSEILPQESEEPSGDSACFSGDALVNIEGGLIKRMSEIAIGDRVSIGSGKFSRVFMFTHKSPEVESKFVQIVTESDNIIELTPGHYIYANRKLVDANTITIGDMLTLENGKKSAVKSVSYTTKTGIYNPQTEHGDIIVDGILASTFTTTIQPDAAQSLLAPLRAAFKAIGATCNLFDNGFGKLSQFIQ